MINWSLLQPVDIAGSFQQGLERGRQMARQRAVEDALSRYPVVINENPSERDVQLLAAYAPQQLAALEAIRSRRAERELEQRQQINRRAIGSVYAAGNRSGAINQAVAGGDLDFAKALDGLDEPQRKQAEARVKAAAPHAYQALQFGDGPEADAQRVAYIQSPEVRRQLEENGWSAQEIDAYSGDKGTLQAIVNGASTIDQMRERQKIVWHQVDERPSFATDALGNPIGSGNPYAGALGGGVPSSAPPAPPSSPATSGGGALTIERNNNPGALRVPGSTEFQRFRTPQDGIRAQEAQLQRYQKRGLNTVASVIETYAPRASRGGDNTDAQVNNYISYVADRLGVDPSAPIPANQIPRLAEAMREFETGNRKPAAGPRKVASKAEYDKLPAGTRYVAPDGSVRTKS